MMEVGLNSKEISVFLFDLATNLFIYLSIYLCIYLSI